MGPSDKCASGFHRTSPWLPSRQRRRHVSYASAQINGLIAAYPVAKIDELHNLNLATRSGAEVSDQLKYFADRLPATFIYAGIDVEAQGLFAGVRGRQIAGRFSVIPAAPFACGTAEQREQWRALIATLESLLRLHRQRPGSLVRLDEYLYRRSGGMIGSLSQLVRGAAILAMEDGSEQISKKLLDSVPVDYAAERADTASRPLRRGSRAMRSQTG